jgi:hypothetical protein
MWDTMLSEGPPYSFFATFVTIVVNAILPP